MNNWQLLKSQALKFLDSKTIWTSFIQQRRYRIIEVKENLIRIEKVSGGLPVRLSEKIVNSALSNIIGKKSVKK